MAMATARGVDQALLGEVLPAVERAILTAGEAEEEDDMAGGE
jgi:hypothetical protein